MFEIHISDVKLFKACRRKWDWASPLRRDLEPNVPYMPFFTGRAVHYCLEMYYRSNVPLLESLSKFLHNERAAMGDLWPQEEAQVSEQIDLLVGVLQHYEVWTENMQDAGKWADDNLEFIALETPFTVPLRNHRGQKSRKIVLSGRMDGVVRVKSDNTVWIWEIKTTRSIKELQRSLANDPQTGAYIYAAQQLFKVEPQGVLYNVLRKKVPTEPEVTTSGLLTRRTNLDTTAAAYVAAIRKHHPDWSRELIWETYGGTISSLFEQGNSFFARIPVRRTTSEIQTLTYDLWSVAQEMTSMKTPIYPNESWLTCNFCPFRAPCLAMNAGSDVEFILANEYRKRVQALSWRAYEEEF